MVTMQSLLNHVLKCTPAKVVPGEVGVNIEENEIRRLRDKHMQIVEDNLRSRNTLK